MKTFIMCLTVALGLVCSARADDARCDIKPDQADSFHFTEGLKIPVIVFYDPAFSKFEHREKQKVVQRAIDDWNKFGNSKFKTPIFQIEKVDLNRGVPQASLKSDLDYKTTYAENRPWVWITPNVSEFTKVDVPGSANGKTEVIRTAGNATLNYAITALAFGGREDQEVHQTALHELGHVIGLDHSCDEDKKYDPDNRVGPPGCEGAPNSYTSAMMYPTWGRVFDFLPLRDNDLKRAYCSITGKRPESKN